MIVILIWFEMMFESLVGCFIGPTDGVASPWLSSPALCQRSKVEVESAIM